MTRPGDPIDAYLLRVLVTLVAERSVSRAAIRLNQSQPAVSAALKRLREVLGDPLLVREKGGMVPTERALQLREHAALALGGIERMLVGPEAFDPAATTQTFHVGSPDYLAMVFLADVVAHFRTEAPRARLVVLPLGADYDYERALAQGELDVVIGNWPDPPEHLHRGVLLEDEIVCLMSRSHPHASAMSAEQYLRAAHVVPVPYSVAQRGVVETHLASRRVTRDARVVVPYFAVAPYLVAQTDLVFTTARHFAEHFARQLPLAVLPAPAGLGFPRMGFYQLWHDRSQPSAAQRWFRGLLTAAGRRLARTSAEAQPASMSGAPSQP